MRLLCALLLVACFQEPAPDEQFMLYDKFRSLPVDERTPVKLGRQSAAAQLRALAHHTVTEISIEWLPGFGPGTLSGFTLMPDGTVRHNFTPRTGRLQPHEFSELAQLILLLGYLDLEGYYHSGGADDGEVFTSIVRNGERKIVRNYGNSGPSELYVLEQLIEGAIAQAEWPD